MEDPKNAPDVEKSLDYALTIANSDRLFMYVIAETKKTSPIVQLEKIRNLNGIPSVKMFRL